MGTENKIKQDCSCISYLQKFHLPILHYSDEQKKDAGQIQIPKFALFSEIFGDFIKL